MFFIIYMEESTCLKHLYHCGIIKSVPPLSKDTYYAISSCLYYPVGE